MMKAAWRTLFVVASIVVLAACQEGVEQISSVPDTVPEHGEQPAPVVDAPDEIDANAGEEHDDRDPGLNDTGDIQRVVSNVPWETAITGGRRVTITFTGGTPGNFDSDCNWDYRADVEETAEAVTIGLVAVRILVPGAHLRDCTVSSTRWAITTSLAQPLGSRELRDDVTQRRMRPVQIETRLTPTWLPDDWVSVVYDETLPQQVSTYGPSGDSGRPKIEVLTSPITVSPRLSDLRTLPDWESIAVRRDADGIFHVDANRVTTVGLEEQGWYYQIVAQPDVDPSVVLEFARSFERPALIEPGALSVALSQPQTTVPLQAGQDEGEARPLQGVLPAR